VAGYRVIFKGESACCVNSILNRLYCLILRKGILHNYDRNRQHSLLPIVYVLDIEIYRTIILPVVLYGCETWSLTLREERRLRVFENRVRIIFEPKSDKVTGEWRKLHNEELNNLYCSPNIVRVIKSRRMKWSGHVARMGEGRGVYRVLVGKSEGKRPLGRPRRGWEDNIKMDLREVRCECVDWMELAQDWDRWCAFVSAVMNLRVS
jgi:hypothetical protein